jgi:hypothetical protein
MLYYGVLNLGANEYGPVNNLEFLYNIMTMITSSMMVAVVFGDVAMMIFILGNTEAIRQEALDNANSVMLAIGLGDEDQDEVRGYLLKT